MRTRTVLLPLALAAGLASTAPASAAPRTSHLMGGDAPPTIPSLVQTRLTRTEKAIERLTRYVDNQQADRVVKVSKVIRRQTTAAWRGAKYYIRHAPPPVAEADSLRAHKLPGGKRKLHGGAVGPVIADPFTTAVAVFGLAHDVSANAIELTDGAHGDTLSGLSKTMFWTLNKRDAMVNEAHALEPPPAAEADRFRPGSRTLKQEEGAPTFATLMPQVTQQLDDELQHIAGLQEDATDLRPRGKTILNRAAAQTTATEQQINAFWPPVAADD
jgi:hypothetical protein